MKDTYGLSYIDSLCGAIGALTGEEFKKDGEIETIDSLKKINEEIVVSISFSGSVSGNYLMALNYNSAKFLLSKIDNSNDMDLLFSILTETLNIAVGEAINSIMEAYENVTFFAPVVSHAPVKYPDGHMLHIILKNEMPLSVISIKVKLGLVYSGQETLTELFEIASCHRS